MADRLARDAIILFKAESTYNTDSTPTASANAMLVSDYTVDPLNAQNAKRDLIRSFLGGAEELVGDRNIPYQFTVEAAGSGTAGTSPAYADPLKSCGLAETVTANTRVDYTPVSTAFGSGTAYLHDSGVKHLATGSRGTAVFNFPLGGRPTIDFSFIGLHNAEAATAQPTGVFTTFKTPEAVTNANSGDIMVGCTHSTSGAPALSGGTLYPSAGIQVDLGQKAEHSTLLGDESVVIGDRETTGVMTLNMTAAQEVQALADMRANTLTSIGFVHGTVTGRKTLLFMGSCQYTSLKKVVRNGKRLIEVRFRALPVNGNDEFRFVTSF
jgi:hypothetical protein